MRQARAATAPSTEHLRNGLADRIARDSGIGIRSFLPIGVISVPEAGMPGRLVVR
jgi:hypothetical protein